MLHQPPGVFEPTATEDGVAPSTLHILVGAGLTGFLVFTDLYLAGVSLKVMATTAAVAFASSLALSLILADRRRPTGQGRP